MNKTIKYLVIFFLLLVHHVNAQQQWSLQQCIEYALKNNLQIRIAYLNNELNKINLDQSKANALPNLNIGANNTYNFGKTIDRFTNQFANTRVQSINMGLQSQWNLFNGLKNYNTIKQNEFNLLAGKKDVERIANDVSLNVANAFLQVLLAKELVIVSQNQLNTSNKQLERIVKMVDAGALPKSNRLEIEGQVANEELNLVNAQNQLSMATLNLALLLNISPDGFDIVVPVLPQPEELPITGSAQQIFDLALNNQPSIKAAEFKVQSNEKSIKIAQSALSPSLSFSGSIGTGYSGLAQQITGYDSLMRNIGFTALGEPVYSLYLNPQYQKTPYSKQFSDNFNRSLGLTLSIPLFNNFQIRNNIKMAKINTESARLQLLQSKLNLQQMVFQAYADATATLRKYNASQKSVASFKEALNNVEQRYNLGAANSVDYITQKNNMANAEAQLLQAKYEYIFKVKILDFYAGKPISL
ncbi:MAG: TolC family protein [Bacteroidia bacterium]|nr:TolC family protein [Bacteroidia bacterium]MCZ2247730.1 TolC family protein [Bacteroidia bacterium]